MYASIVAVLLAVTAVGSVIVLRGPEEGSTAALSTHPDRHSITPTASVTPAPATSSAPARAARTPEEVLARTRFVQRYRQGQPAISRKHPDIGDNGLANHGATMCAMIADPGSSIFDLVSTFMMEFHAHPGPVTEQSALLTARLAVDEICPDLAGQLQQKESL